jgi:hypothetical protein
MNHEPCLFTLQQFGGLFGAVVQGGGRVGHGPGQRAMGRRTQPAVSAQRGTNTGAA